MSEEVQVTGEAQAQVSAEEQVNADALKRYNDSQQEIREDVSGEAESLPEGYNADGTPTVEAEKIGGKFETQEDLLKAYQELEAKLGKSEPTEPEVTTEAETTEPKTEESTKVEDVAQTTEFSKFHDEFNNSGELSEDSYKELADKGFTKQDVEAYIAGQQALANDFSKELFEVAGGETEYNSLVEWATDNADADTIEDYNTAINTGDTRRVKQLVELMTFKKQASQPTAPNRLDGVSTSETGGLKAFGDKGEWQSAMRNPLYGKDTKYTGMIDRRYLASKKKGTI